MVREAARGRTVVVAVCAAYALIVMALLQHRRLGGRLGVTLVRAIAGLTGLSALALHGAPSASGVAAAALSRFLPGLWPAATTACVLGAAACYNSARRTS